MTRSWFRDGRVFMMRALFLVILLGCAVPVHALRYVLTPTLGLGGTFDDRIREDHEDWYVRTTPGLALAIEQDRYRVRLAADASAYAYQEYTEYDRVDQTYQASVDYGWSERLRLGLSGNVRLDTDYEDEYEEGRVEDVEASDRQTYSLSPSVSFLLAPRDSLAVAYSCTRRENEADYNPDYLGHLLDVTWTHQYSEVLDLFTRASAQRTTYETYRAGLGSTLFAGELVQDTLSLMGGASYRPSERLTLSVALGGGETFTDRDGSELDLGGLRIAMGDGERSSAFNYLVNSNLEWKDERWSIKGGYDRDIYSSAEGEDVLRNSLNAGIAFRVTELASLGASTLVRHLVDNTDRGDRDDWYYSLNPYLSFQTTKDSSLRLGYTYSQLREKDQESEARNRCALDYVISFPVEY